MSFAEIQEQALQLPTEQQEALRSALERELRKAASAPLPRTLAAFIGCTDGLMTFHADWEEDEPVELWEALRD